MERKFLIFFCYFNGATIRQLITFAFHFVVDLASKLCWLIICWDLFYRLLGQTGLTHLVVRLVWSLSKQLGSIFQPTIIQMYQHSFLHWIYIQKWLNKYYFGRNIPLILLWQFNFVGRFLGPRGNSLNRVEASTDCRFLIRGRGSILIYYFRKCWYFQNNINFKIKSKLILNKISEQK